MELTADHSAAPFTEARQELTEPEAVETHVRRRGAVSPLTRRIFMVNSLALGILLGGLLYLGQYEDSLVEAELDALTLAGSLDYQACNDTVCFDPVSVPLSFTLHLEPHDTQRANRP